MFPLEQGAFEMVLIGVFALIVVGPKDLPVLMRRVGQAMAKMRGLAAEFRASFDEMARQSELEDLRKEVEALRTGGDGSDQHPAQRPDRRIERPQRQRRCGVARVRLSALAPGLRAPGLRHARRRSGRGGRGGAERGQAQARPQTQAYTRCRAGWCRSRRRIVVDTQAPPRPRQGRSRRRAGGGRLSADDTEIEASRAPLLEHLAELRTRLIICIAAIAVGFVLSFSFAQDIYVFLVRPFEMASAISSQKGAAQSVSNWCWPSPAFTHPVALHPATLQATGPLEIFFTKMKLAMFAAIMITFPVLAWQLYRFVAPGLYKRGAQGVPAVPFSLAGPVRARRLPRLFRHAAVRDVVFAEPAGAVGGGEHRY